MQISLYYTNVPNTKKMKLPFFIFTISEFVKMEMDKNQSILYFFWRNIFKNISPAICLLNFVFCPFPSSRIH